MTADNPLYQPVEVYLGGSGTAPLLLTCEHASNQMPPEWEWPENDRKLQESHWAWDPGAGNLTRSLADEVNATAVLSRFTRLLIDPNRPLDHDDLFRDNADGASIEFNQNLSSGERSKRIELYSAYHQALARQARNRRGQFLLSIHSFTPVYEGVSRDLQAGVMHVGQEELANQWQSMLQGHGLKTLLDEPYSGKNGYMYSAHKHADSSGRDAILLEFRQDVIQEREDLVEVLRQCLVESKVLHA